MIKKEDLKIDYRATIPAFLPENFSEILAECQFSFRTCFKTGVPIRFVSAGERLKLDKSTLEMKEILIANQIVKKMMWLAVYGDILKDLIELRRRVVCNHLINGQFAEDFTKLIEKLDFTD